MRRYIVTMLLLSLYAMARGQTAGYDYRYWFDFDPGTTVTGHADGTSWHLDADLNGLTDDLHAIHLQVTDGEGKSSSTQTRYFVKLGAWPEIFTARYWFDGDYATVNSGTFANGVSLIDVSELTDGFHKMHISVGDGTPSSTVTRYFMKMTAIADDFTTRYWFDDDFSTIVSGRWANGISMIDVSQLTDGFHKLTLIVGDEFLSKSETRFFLKLPQTENVGNLTCLAFIDNVLYTQEEVAPDGGWLHWTFDVSQVPVGLHRLQLIAITPSGAATSMRSSMFLRMTTQQELDRMKLVYFIDGGESHVLPGNAVNGAFHFDVDVENLTDGLHRISYMLSDTKGNDTRVTNRFFFKTPLGGNGITQYEYWLNENDDNHHQVSLDSRVNPFQLISLLPVETEPLRSCNFHFELTQGQPMMYARNTINLRFFDASGRFVTQSADYTDYNVSQAVTDIIVLNDGDHKTTARPEDNTVQWYCFEAEPGDSIAFRSSQAATLQVFSPSGKEIYSAFGSNSVKYGGCHVLERGTFFVALHDVAGSQPNISLDYFHMGKYAVLSNYPKEVGVKEGNFYVSLYGNGYDKLTKAQLVDEDNVLTAEIIQVQDCSNAILQFSFADDSQPRGNYDLVLEFTDGDEIDNVTVGDAVTIADPIFGDIAVDVISRQTVAKPYPVTVKIKNTGNVTYQFVPLYFANSINQLESMHLHNFGMQSNKNVMDAGIKTFYKVDNLFGEDSCIVIPTIIPYVNPYQDIEYQIGYVTGPHARFNMYAWTETPWNMRDTNFQYARNKGSRKARVTNITCEMNPCDLVSNIPNAGCVCSVLWANVSAIANAYGAMNQRRNNILRNQFGRWYEDNGIEWPYRDIPVKTPADIIDQVIRECLGELLPDELARLQEAIESAMEMIRDRDREQCPPPPPHPIDPYMPGDPNDIFGYTSESGSKYMREGTTDVYYTIEFENDPKIANASAHTIVVTDTLDASRFDLSTFAATSIKLGDKETVQLDGVKSLDRMSIDLRPEINVIAQVSLSLDEQKGIAQWTIESLDPMTMEPTNDAMQGVLPVNINGNGQGDLCFDIKLKPGMVEGDMVSNRVGIVFDQESTIMTPTWTNIVDATAPESHVANVVMATDTTAAVSIAASDELSGPWRYNVYVQYGSGAWFLGAENVPIDKAASVRVYEGINHGFYTIVTDSAGNVEQKDAVREYTLEVFGSHLETNTQLALAEGWNWISQNQQEALSVEAVKPKAQRIVSQTEELYKDARLGWSGDLEELLPTEMYKVQMTEGNQVQLSGLLFNAAFRSVPLREGWNWMGYPVAHTMTPAEALAKLEAEEGDILIGQDGMAQFSDGQWTGTLTELQPGLGYMYYSVSDKNLFLNATAQSSSRMVHRSRFIAPGSEIPEGWTVNKRKYPNVMGMVCDLYQEGTLADHDEWLVGAFCGDECRGLSQTAGGHLMMNIYGQGGEEIVFLALHRGSGEVVDVIEVESFRSDVLGTLQQPYELHSGTLTGIAQMEGGKLTGEDYVYDLQGRRVKKSSLFNSQSSMQSKGVYIMTDGKKSRTRKVVKK